MASQLTLPDIPRIPIYSKAGVMDRVWQEFFRSLFTRVGGNDAPTNGELGDGAGFSYDNIASDYTVKSTDATIFIDASANDITVTLITAVDNGGKIFAFKRVDNSNFTVTIVPDGVETIDNESSAILYGYESMDMRSNNINWWII